MRGRCLNLVHLQHGLGIAALAMIANRRRPGTTSRKSSSRLPAVSVAWIDRPVTLPPGRARLATRPVPTGSPAIAKTIGMTDVACFAASALRFPRDNDIDLEPDELGRDLGEALAASLRPAILDRDGAALDPAEFAQPLHKGGGPLAPSRRRARAQEPDGRQLRRLLRPRRERPAAAAPPSSVMNSRRLMPNTVFPSAVGPPHVQRNTKEVGKAAGGSGSSAFCSVRQL